MLREDKIWIANNDKGCPLSIIPKICLLPVLNAFVIM